MEKTKLVPKVRFRGYTDAWEQKELGNMMDVTSVKRIHRSDWTDEGIRFIRARDIVAKSKSEKIADPLFISKEKYNEYTALSGKVKIGDMLVTGVGTIGVPMLIDSEEPLYFKDGNVIWFKNENAIEGNFFYYSFIGESIQNFIRETSGSGTVGTYTIDSGKKTPILLPKNRDEQFKIGEFLLCVDNVMNFYQRKLGKMKTVKRSLLEKMFPRNGSNIPEIRFSGYAGGWKQQKIGDMTGFITGKPFSNELAIDGKYIVMDMGSVSQEGKRIEYKKTNEARDMLQENDLVMPKDDIGGGLIIGRTAYIPSNNHYVLGDHVYRLRFNDVNGRFIHYQINSDYIRGQIMPLVTGSAQLGLSSKNINDICLNIPSIDEQNKIVYLLDTVDNLIDFYQFKLEKLKDIKKAFLDKMFVKVEV